MRSLLIVVALTGACALSLGASPAAAKTPCWRALINDWYDGHIDGTYPLHCYREAIKNAPDDLRIYSDLPDDLSRAMRTILNQRAAAKAQTPPTSPSADGSNGTSPGGRKATSKTKGVRNVQIHKAKVDRRTTRTGPLPGRDTPSGPIQKALKQLGPSRADSLPIPLLVLAGVAFLLIATGGVSVVARRVHARRAPPGPPAP